MLDNKDLQAIAGLMSDQAKKTEATFLNELDKKITRSETLLLDEMERFNKKYEKQFDSIAKNFEELKTYRMTKTENETINMLLRIIENLEKRVSELENKTA